jgi:FAD synthase
LYGQALEVDFYCRLRNIQRFAGVDALVAQLQKDVDAANQAFQQVELSDKLASAPQGGQG